MVCVCVSQFVGAELTMKGNPLFSFPLGCCKVKAYACSMVCGMKISAPAVPCCLMTSQNGLSSPPVTAFRLVSTLDS